MNKFINRIQIPSIFLFLLYLSTLPLQAQVKLEVLDSNSYILGEGVVLSKTSFRGLSVVNDDVVWVSGSRGTIARSTNGGKTFSFSQIKGYEKSDFRDIEAFDEQTAIIMSSGTPAYILKTTDGGRTWKEVFKRMDTAYFLDAMDFWDHKKGVLVGDPINGHFVLLKTTDGGNTWQELDTSKTPRAMEGEAVFAASGTSLRCWGKKDFGFVTGGSISRFIRQTSNQTIYSAISTGIIHGKSSQGAFSFAVSNLQNKLLFAGGDYLNDGDTSNTDCTILNINPETNNISPQHPFLTNETSGYKSAIEIVEDGKAYWSFTIITTGTNKTHIANQKSSYNGQFLNKIATYNEPFHTVRKAKKGKAIYLAGPKGKIGRLVY